MREILKNLLEQQLLNKGWNINLQDPKKNVFHQQAKTPEENRKLASLKPDFCLYIKDGATNPDIIIETKKPNMNLSKTKYQALKYANILKSKIIILFDGIQTKTYWVENEKELLHDGLPITSIMSKDFYENFLSQNSHFFTKSNTIIQSKEELINVFAFTNQKLRKAGITKGMERFFEFSNLLFLKLISEENEIVSESIPEFIKWEAYKHKTGEELLAYINNIVIPELENIFNQQNESILFSNLIIQDTKALKQIIDKLDELNLSGIQTDIKGDAFEYFIQQYNTSNNDLGEYFTPRHIVNFLIYLSRPKYGEKIYDPFCGTGGMLIAAFNHIKETLVKNNYLSKAVLKDLKENTIYGGEISSSAKIAKMNMILTGDGHSNVKQHDTLLNPIKQKFDLIITNIPFNLEGTASSYYSLLSNNGNSQSIQHILDSLNNKKTARAYVIVPESVLNNKELKQLRTHLIKNNLLKQIISLPSGVFLPYTDAKASILILQGYNNKKISHIKYTKIKNDGFTLTQRRRKITNSISDLEEYVFNNSYATKEIQTDQILKNKNCSFIWFKYFNDMPKNYILLSEIIEEENIKNISLHKTITISNKEFFGILSGEEYWKESFISVTSSTNEAYKVVNEKSISYNPSRANTGSIGINLKNKKFAVSKMYVTFKIKNKKFLPEYIYLYLKSQEGIQAIKDRSFGSVRQSLRYEDLETIPIPNISLTKQEKIIKNAIKKYELFEKYKKELDSFDLLNFV